MPDHNKLFFGTLNRLRMLPGAISPATVTETGYSETLNYVNGGADVVRSWAGAKQWDLTWVGNPSEVNPYKSYSRGVFGDGLIYFQNPMAQRHNLFAPNWAAPALVEQGDWKNIYQNAPTFTNTPANNFGHPFRQAVFSVTSAANVVTEKHTIIIPPNKTLWLGWSGTTTGTGAIRVRPVTVADGVNYGTIATLPVSAVTSSTRLTTSYSGVAFKAVEVFITRTTSAASTVTVASMMAQLHDTGITPVVVGEFIPGEGTLGCKFTGQISESQYLAAGPGLEHMGASMVLQEVEPWL